MSKQQRRSPLNPNTKAAMEFHEASAGTVVLENKGKGLGPSADQAASPKTSTPTGRQSGPTTQRPRVAARCMDCHSVLEWYDADATVTAAPQNRLHKSKKLCMQALTARCDELEARLEALGG